MPNFELRIQLVDVTEGDATMLAQEVYDAYAGDYDAKLGEFTIRVLELRGEQGFDLGWEPADA